MPGRCISELSRSTASLCHFYSYHHQCDTFLRYASAQHFWTVPGPHPAKLCLCSAAQCCADAFQIPAIPWPSFSFLRPALPPRFGTMPVRNTAMPWLHISLPAPPCSVLCPGYAAHIRRSTILCRRISVQSHSVPLQVRSVLSRTIPLPCLATLCHSPAVLFPGIALRYYSLALPYFTPMRLAKTGLLNSVHFHFPAFRSNAMPRLFAAMPCHCFSILCPRRSSHGFAQAPLWYALPVQVRS